MSIQDKAFRAPLRLPIASGDIAPNPGPAGITVWSTTTNSLMHWNGSVWGAIVGSNEASASTFDALVKTDGAIPQYSGEDGAWQTTTAPDLLLLDGGNF